MWKGGKRSRKVKELRDPANPKSPRKPPWGEAAACAQTSLLYSHLKQKEKFPLIYSSHMTIESLLSFQTPPGKTHRAHSDTTATCPTQVTSGAVWLLATLARERTE